MSDTLRTAKEYVELYAKKHNISVDEAYNAVMVKMFGEYAKHDDDKDRK